MATFKAKGEDLYIDGKKVLRAWESFSGWYWFGTEIVDEVDYRGKPRWFGFVQGLEEEWGYFAQGELEELNAEAEHGGGLMKAIWPIKKIDLPYAGRRH